MKIVFYIIAHVDETMEDISKRISRVAIDENTDLMISHDFAMKKLENEYLKNGLEFTIRTISILTS